MQQHTLRITAQHQPTALERLLQVTRYRGFSVLDITMFPKTNEQLIEINMNVSSTHSIDHLKAQLAKLIDINEICIEGTEKLQCSA